MMTETASSLASAASAATPSHLSGLRLLAYAMIVCCAVACAGALLFQRDLRAYYWYLRLRTTTESAARSHYFAGLMGQPDATRWATCGLLRETDVELRQLGAVLLQHVRAEWATSCRATALRDADAAVRDLAAQAIARRDGNAAIGFLCETFRSGTDAEADAAAFALSLIASSEADAALAELSTPTLTEQRRCSLVEALGRCDAPACLAALETLAEDATLCMRPTRRQQLSEEMLVQLRADGFVPPPPSSAPAEVDTVGARARAALAQHAAQAASAASNQHDNADTRDTPDATTQPKLPAP